MKTNNYYDKQSETAITTTGRLIVNLETGETTQEVDIKHYGAHFWRLYLQNFLAALGKFNLALLDVLCFIIENANLSDNTCSFTQTEIALALSLSRATVGRHIETLEQVGFIKKIRNGKYMINPDILHYDVSKGSKQHNILMRMYYADEPIAGKDAKNKRCKTKHTKANAAKRKQKKEGEH